MVAFDWFYSHCKIWWTKFTRSV